MSIRNLSIILFLVGLTSCKKFIQVGPPKDQISSATVYSSDATAIAVMRGIYSQMVNNGSGFASGGMPSVTINCGLSADELTNYSNDPNWLSFYTNALTSNNFSTSLWSDPYKFINNANAVIEGLANSIRITPATKNELQGEAEFVRAFCYFYLVNLFGDVPLITSTNYTVNALAARSPVSLVYQQIIADLSNAQNHLAADFSYAGGERDQPNKWAAIAMLGRVYLYMGDWKNAEIQTTSIIDNSTMYSLNGDLDSVFLKNSSEAIWQLQPIGGTFNTNEGSNFIITSDVINVSLSDHLRFVFEDGDHRKMKWVDSALTGNGIYYYPYKYKVKTSSILSEYSMVLRLAEQYLIRSEARAQQGNIPGSQSDLNIIRNRAGLSNTLANDEESLLAAILHERQVELFTEWGHRWLDLKRTGNIDAVMSVETPQKGGIWNTIQQLYPIPRSEISNDANLTQNAGY